MIFYVSAYEGGPHSKHSDPAGSMPAKDRLLTLRILRYRAGQCPGLAVTEVESGHSRQA